MKRYFGAFKNQIMLTNKWEQVPEKAEGDLDFMEKILGYFSSKY